MNSHNSNPSINAAELKQRLDAEEMLTLLDVRTPLEYHSHNIGGNNIPLDKLETKLPFLTYNKSEEIIVICSAGKRSKTAQSILIQNGYQQIRNLEGGLNALQKLRS